MPLIQQIQFLSAHNHVHGVVGGMHHHGGTGVYLPGMDHGAGAQTHGGGATGYLAGPMVSARGPDYQLVPVAPPVAAWTGTGGTMASAGCPAEAWGAAYGGSAASTCTTSDDLMTRNWLAALVALSFS